MSVDRCAVSDWLKSLGKPFHVTLKVPFEHAASTEKSQEEGTHTPVVCGLYSINWIQNAT